jgi:putative oxygen-independent coproporphyrinogen III oxidase
MISTAQAQNKPAASLPPLAVYIHWPFCKKKCPYCDFNSHVRERVEQDAWRTALLKELRYWHGRAPLHEVTSIFFGGGTPSLMPPETVRALIDEVRQLWSTAPDIEITLEANPTSVEAEKFAALRQAGVNRVSLGVQSLQAESLKFLGREHSATEARAAIALARELFPRYSFDLIYALPGQTLGDWEAELREALTLSRGHLSLYQLTIEENTAFHHAYHVTKSFALPEENLAASLYERTQEIMGAAGLPAYEISNHAAPGQESRHNQSYWRSDAYLGIGPGAHGRVTRGSERISTRNLKSPERWLERTTHDGNGLEEETILTAAERAEEKLLMGLRLVGEGCNLARLDEDERSYLTHLWRDGRVEALVQQGMLQRQGELLTATAQGRLLLNTITAQLLAS